MTLMTLAPEFSSSSTPVGAPADVAAGLVDIRAERAGDFAGREALLDAALGPHRRRKTCERLREGRLPARGLALVAQDGDSLVGSVRLWNVDAGGAPALMLGPLAVAGSHRRLGVGGRLLRVAIAQAKDHGHKAVLLVGDAAYYARFGFGRDITRNLVMPGPVEAERFLGLEIAPGALRGALGLVRPTGLKLAWSAASALHRAA